MTRPPMPDHDAVIARCVIAAASQTIDGSQVDNTGRPIQYLCPVVILDDGSAFRLDSDDNWRKLPAVPTTEAGIEFQRRVDALPPMEE